MNLLYEGSSAQSAFSVKNKLENAGIPYRASEKAKGGWLRSFFFFSMAPGRSYGSVRNEERSVSYRIYVESKDYEKAARLLLDAGISPAQGRI